MPMPERRPSGKVLSKTLEVVLGKRPCRVIIDSVPGRARCASAVRPRDRGPAWPPIYGLLL